RWWDRRSNTGHLGAVEPVGGPRLRRLGHRHRDLDPGRQVQYGEGAAVYPVGHVLGGRVAVRLGHDVVDVPVVQGVVEPLLERVQVSVVVHEAGTGEGAGQLQSHDVVVAVHPAAGVAVGQAVKNVGGA